MGQGDDVVLVTVLLMVVVEAGLVEVTVLVEMEVVVTVDVLVTVLMEVSVVVLTDVSVVVVVVVVGVGFIGPSEFNKHRKTPVQANTQTTVSINCLVIT